SRGSGRSCRRGSLVARASGGGPRDGMSRSRVRADALAFRPCRRARTAAARCCTMSETLKERVREFWEREPCGTKTASSTPGTPEFFAEVERRRYELEPFILDFADFEDWRDRD